MSKENVEVLRRWVDTFNRGDFAGALALFARGRARGARFEEQEIHVFRLRDGKVIEGREYRETSEALEAMGLPD